MAREAKSFVYQPGAVKMNSENRELISLDEVGRIVALGKSEIYQQVKLENFPKPIKLSARCSRWVRSEVLNWVEQRLSDRDAGKTDLLRKPAARAAA
jgi:prophage regulatory protein